MIHPTTKVCVLCGETFTTTSLRRKICEKPHYKKCECCGNEFLIRDYSDTRKCCSRKCTESMKKIRREATMIKRYGAPYALQKDEFLEKSKETSLERYGVEHAAQNEDIKKKTQKMFESKYGVKSPFQMKDFQEKASKTCLERYGVEFTSQIPDRIDKALNTCVEKYGGPCPLSDVDLRRKAARNRSNKSSLEIRLCQFLDNLDIQYEQEYVLKSELFTHAFDLFLPKYQLLIDCDGAFFHGYLEDPDGKWVNTDYDVLRLTCVKEGYKFIKITESNFESDLNNLKNMLKLVDKNLFDYESEIFKWCRSIEFPFPSFSDERLFKEWKRLQALKRQDYNLRSNIGISIVNQFHKSIWKSHVKNLPSPYEAWYDDKLLKKCIINRTIYQDTVDSSKVLQGFNVSKIAPKVSVFRPVLAKHLIMKYLNDSKVIRDPFSGFSGRMLGVLSAGKQYIGSDIRLDVLLESDEIKKFLKIDDDACKLFKHDVNHVSTIEEPFDALFTCPPYLDKEQWTASNDFKTCDEWMTLCLERFENCRKFLFVVDQTSQYKNHIVEEIDDPSHFRRSKEYIVLITK